MGFDPDFQGLVDNDNTKNNKYGGTQLHGKN
jgi:hypothetical protein